jgi:hypothetical protein
VNKITAAIKASGNEGQQALVLWDTLSHPKVIKIVKSAGFELSWVQSVAFFNMRQQS